jgi:hypothetical protein
VLISVRMCGSQCIGVDRCCEVCYNVFGSIVGVGVALVGVMRKFKETLTYRGDKMRERYQDHKKNFSQVKMPLDLFEELCYICECLWETVNIIGSHYMKKFPKDKNGL